MHKGERARQLSIQLVVIQAAVAQVDLRKSEKIKQKCTQE